VKESRSKRHRRPRGQTLRRVLKTLPCLSEVWRVTLTCFAYREYDSCGKKQEASVHISGERPTLLMEAMVQLEQARTRAKAANIDHEECDKKSSDDMDLTDHRREATRIQKRRSIPLGSRRASANTVNTKLSATPPREFGFDVTGTH
jgi:hypothetical protein